MDIGYLNGIEEILTVLEKMFEKENIKKLYMDFIEIFCLWKMKKLHQD